MCAQVENKHPPSSNHDADRLGESGGGGVGVVQRLREKGQIHRPVGDRDALDLAASPDDIRRPPPLGELPRAAQDVARAVDGNHALRPAGDFDRQIALAAADIGDGQRRKQQAESACPCRPAPPGHQLTRLAAVRLEVLLPQPQDLLQSRLVLACRGGPAHLGELRVEQRPQRLGRASGVRMPPVVGPELQLGAYGSVGRLEGQPVVREACFAFLAHEADVLQEAEMPGHAGLGDAQDSCELGDVQALAVEQAQQPQAGVVAEKPVQRSSGCHIYKCRYIDAPCQPQRQLLDLTAGSRPRAPDLGHWLPLPAGTGGFRSRLDGRKPEARDQTPSPSVLRCGAYERDAT